MTTESVPPTAAIYSPVRGIDRRSLIKAGAWAAPALLVAVAAPAAVASSVLTKPAIDAKTPGARGTKGGAVVDYASVFYDYNAWGLKGKNPQAAGPQSASVVWRVVLKRADGTVFGYFPIGAAGATTKTSVLVQYGTDSVSGVTLTGVPAGAYTVVTQVVTVTYTPNPIGGVTFATSAFSSAPKSITVT